MSGLSPGKAGGIMLVAVIVVAGLAFCGVFLVWPISRGYAMQREQKARQEAELAAWKATHGPAAQHPPSPRDGRGSGAS